MFGLSLLIPTRGYWHLGLVAFTCVCAVLLVASFFVKTHHKEEVVGGEIGKFIGISVTGDSHHNVIAGNIIGETVNIGTPQPPSAQLDMDNPTRRNEPSPDGYLTQWANPRGESRASTDASRPR